MDKPPALDESGQQEDLVDLLASARHGREGAWNEIVDRFGPVVLAIARRAGLAHAECEEVVQSTFLALFQALNQLSEDRALRAWLATTAQRQAWKLMRERRRAEPIQGQGGGGEAGAPPFVEYEAPSESPLEECLALERRVLIEQEIRNLSPVCAGVIGGLFLSGVRLDYRQLARDLGLPIGSVGPTRMRCLAELGRLLRARGFAPDR